MNRKSIREYRQKRDFTKTPEPPPQHGAQSGGALEYVVHRHDATRLHYDLRIEMDGVLKSWAVPKGFSFDPKTKHLAVRTEDHPLEYKDFHGIIPAGQYGAGSMTIWDRGAYTLLEADDGAAAVDAGKLVLEFYGGRLRGQWHMVKLSKEPNGWLIFKGKDRYARGKEEPVFGIDVTQHSRSPFPKRLQSMRVGRRLAAPETGDWLYEVKLNGIRCLAVKQGDEIRFRGVQPRNLHRRVPEVVASLAKLRAATAIVDGILVALDSRGRPAREVVDTALDTGDSGAIQFYALDLLYLDQWDMRRFPLSERKAALASIVPKSMHLFLVEHERSRAAELIQSAAAMGLPAVIARRADSPYRAGASDDWIEIPVASTSRDAPTAKSPSSVSARVEFTNRNKILWPQDGYTKGDLIDYYDQVADRLIPFLRDRPLSLNRFPNGIDKDSFYQKDVPTTVPDWLATATLPSSNDKGEIRYVLCNDRETLLYLANLASIDLHPWLSRRTDPDCPDFAVFDLDPLHVAFEHLITVAEELGRVLEEIGLRSYLKTSGSKGLHAVIPLEPGYSYQQSRTFCEGVARLVAHRLPELATVERAKRPRHGKIYIDYMQNRRGQTVVAPYVVRPVAGARVSAPIDWYELPQLDPNRFTIRTMPRRLDEVGDLFAPALTDRQDLRPAIDAILAMLSSQQ